MGKLSRCAALRYDTPVTYLSRSAIKTATYQISNESCLSLSRWGTNEPPIRVMAALLKCTLYSLAHLSTAHSRARQQSRHAEAREVETYIHPMSALVLIACLQIK